MVLQLIGVLTVWLDLTATARHFGKSGFMRPTWRWLKAGIFGRNVVLSASGASIGISGGRARMKVRRPIQAGAPLGLHLYPSSFVAKDKVSYS
jgi:hypothetical protein